MWRPLLAALVLSAGCLGLDHVFPDESTSVAQLRINAYQNPREDAHVEILGVSGDNASHAFVGHVRIALERQLNASGEPAYETVRSWEIDLSTADFANPGERPVYDMKVPRATFREAGTYRAVADAAVGGRVLHGEALFDAEAG